MREIKNRYFEGERVLYGLNDANLDGITFGEGELPLKEAQNINLKNSIFKWKYPLWYDENVKVENTTFETMSRSGIWYTKNISIKNSALQTPKLFRRASHITLDMFTLLMLRKQCGLVMILKSLILKLMVIILVKIVKTSILIMLA